MTTEEIELLKQILAELKEIKDVLEDIENNTSRISGM
jgi:hypothetical protein